LSSQDQSRSIRIVQVTDSHLFAETDGKLLGLETTHSLSKVLDLVRDEQPVPDFFLCSGDLAQDASVTAYTRFRDMVGEFGAPQYWLPGNHDRREPMAEVARDCGALTKVIRLGNWQIILLDTLVPGSVHGYLEQDELDTLREALTEKPGLNTLVCFHHQPVPIGSRWLDNLDVKNADQLLDIIDQHRNIKCVLWGHVHQEYDDVRKGVRFLATPSTCVQFKTGSEDFKADTLAPGYRWLELKSNGEIETGVSRVSGIDFEIDYSVKGY